MPPHSTIEVGQPSGPQLTLGEVRAWLAACYGLPDDTPVTARTGVAFSQRPPLRVLSVETGR